MSHFHSPWIPTMRVQTMPHQDPITAPLLMAVGPQRLCQHKTRCTLLQFAHNELLRDMNGVKWCGTHNSVWAKERDGRGDKSVTFNTVSLFYNGTEYRTFRQYKMSAYYYSDAIRATFMIYINQPKKLVASEGYHMATAPAFVWAHWNIKEGSTPGREK